MGSTCIHILSLGHGFGFQDGGEMTDFISVLQMDKAINTFSGNIHFFIVDGLNAVVGLIWRAVEVDLCARDGGFASC